jgi:hypothetical protein
LFIGIQRSAQEADFDAVHIRLVEVLKAVVMLRDPGRILHDKAFCLTVEGDPPGIIVFLASLLQELIDSGIAVAQ